MRLITTKTIKTEVFDHTSRTTLVKTRVCWKTEHKGENYTRNLNDDEISWDFPNDSQFHYLLASLSPRNVAIPSTQVPEPEKELITDDELEREFSILMRKQKLERIV